MSADEKTTRADVESLWSVFAAGDESGLEFDDLGKECFVGNSPRTAPDWSLSNSFGVSSVSFRIRDATLFAAFAGKRYCARPVHDSSWILHDEIKRYYGNDSDLMARIRVYCPYAPADQTKGYQDLTNGLEDMLCRITGFQAFSLQPNAGSQGELAGLLAIRAYHEGNGEAKRNICLIPSSAHGTNPASAILAGMQVVVVGCDAEGNVDIADLEAKAVAHKDDLAALDGNLSLDPWRV